MDFSEIAKFWSVLVSFHKVMIVFQDFMQVRLKPCITSILIVDASSLFVQRNSCEGRTTTTNKWGSTGTLVDLDK